MFDPNNADPKLNGELRMEDFYHVPPTRTKADISRENGAKSRGPKTLAGKAISSRNAVIHQLTAKALCFRNENPVVYEELVDKFESYFNPPDDGPQFACIESMAVSRWQEERSWSIESGLIDLQMDLQKADLAKKYPDMDEATRTANAFKTLVDESHALQLLLRYRTAAARRYDQALKQLLLLRKEAVLQKTSKPPDPEPPKDELRNEPSAEAKPKETKKPPRPPEAPEPTSQAPEPVLDPTPTPPEGSDGPPILS